MDPRINRRTILKAVPATLVGGVGTQALTGSALGAGGSGCQYTVDQGSLSEEVVPLSNGDSVEEFFPQSSNNGIERDLTSVVFLWEGPKGISLVVINDRRRSSFIELSHSITFEFDGLPIDEGSWVVTNDRNDFNDPETDTTVDWNWTSSYIDGGAFHGGLDDGFEITVDTDNPFLIGGLQFISGDPTNPERIPLDLGSEFTIKGTGCSIEVDIGIKPSEDDDKNAINLRRRGGNIPVAILNNDDFDPDNVDFDSLRFGAPDVVKNGRGAKPAHSDPLEVGSDGDLSPVPHWEDVDDDGDLDLVVHFPAEDTGFEGDESSARLEGETKDGTPLFGTDSVTFVGGSGSGGGKGGRGDRSDRGGTGGGKGKGR